MPVWVYDLETLAFLAVNDAAIKHYSYSREEFLGMTLKDIRPPEDVPLLLERLSKPGIGFHLFGRLLASSKKRWNDHLCRNCLQDTAENSVVGEATVSPVKELLDTCGGAQTPFLLLSLREFAPVHFPYRPEGRFLIDLYSSASN